MRFALAAALLAAFWLPGLARAELVPGSQDAQDSLLALRADGSPLVAFADSTGAVQLATRSLDGVWSTQTVPFMDGTPELLGLADTPRGVVILGQAANGRWLDLAEQTPSGWRVRTIALSPAHGLLGFAGLAIDPGGRPLIAYPALLQSRKSELHLVHEDTRGRLLGEAITRKGFPKSTELPMASPVVLPNGSVRVVEVYAGAAIEWSRTKNHKDWTGQVIYVNSLGEPAGTVHAVPRAGGGVWSAWTELFPSYNESHVVLAAHGSGQQAAVLSHHAFVIGLAQTAAGPEVAGDDYVVVGDTRNVYAGLVLDAAGTATELAGNLEGYAIDAGGSRNYLLLDADGLGWYRAPSPPAATIAVAAAVSGASFTLTGHVAGVQSGSVEVWRETQSGSELAATVPLAADGTFTLTDTPPARPLTYRVVYRDPVSQLPIAALVRSVLGG